MRKFIDITGERFSMLRVIRRSDFRGNNGKEILFECKCDCGNIKAIRSNDIRSGTTRSCGCMSVDNRFKTKHNKSFSLEYRCWQAMKKRCSGAEERYNGYVIKGVTVCNEWINDFQRFYLDMGDAPSSKHTIDRVNNNEGYNKSNCRWATRSEQNRNYSRNRLLTYNNETLCVTEWAERVGIDRHLIFNRLQKGWAVEKALIPKLRGRGCRTQSLNLFQ